MMASTLADNSSTRPCASGRKGEQEIAPIASRRRYDCKRLHLGNYPTPIVGYGGSAIIGYALSLLALPKLAGVRAGAISHARSEADGTLSDRHLLVGLA